MNDTHATNGAKTMTTTKKTTGMTEKQREQFDAFYAARQKVREERRKGEAINPTADLDIPTVAVEYSDEQLTF